jgi:uncharacterized protein involved in exopolysaccharide biosynthesis
MKYEIQAFKADNLPRPESSISVSELASIFHRRKWLIAGVFSAIFFTVALVTFLTPSTYISSAKVLLKRERAESVVSPTEDTRMVVKAEVSEEAMNSESEIFLSTPLLEKVVKSSNLDKLILETRDDDAPKDSSIIMSIAITRLRSALSADPVPKSSIIRVSYESEDPKLAANVVNDLCHFYVDRHLEVHKNSGVYSFFQQQADELNLKLKQCEIALRDFEAKHGIVAIDQQRQLALQQLASYESQLNSMHANAQEAAEKVDFLTNEISKTPEIIQSQSRSAYNAVLNSMRKELAELQAETQKMLETLKPNSKEARDLKARVAQLEISIRREETAPTPAITADVSRAIVDYNAQLTQARSSIRGYTVQANVMSAAIHKIKAELDGLEAADLTHQALLRDYQLAQSNYVLYVKKQEEARISEALDQEKFANVSIIEPAIVPLSPARPNKMLNLAMGFAFALMASFGTAYGMSFFDTTIRSKRDVEYHLSVPVIAAIPESNNGQTHLLPEGSFEQL